MKATFRTLLTCLVALGMAAVSSHPATAATTKKKTVATKKLPAKAKPAHQSPVRPVAHHAALQEDTGAGPIEQIRSAAVAVIDQSTGDVLYEKNADAVVPIASITKLMTAMVALDVQPDLSETLTITEADVDTIKGTHSRLAVGTQLSREQMLRLALMSSENRAASALSRHYPGGRAAFVAAMNAKAKMLGLTDTRFVDPTGLTPENVSSARDLVKLVNAAHQYPLIREFTTTDEYQVVVRGRPLIFRNTNSLVKKDDWNIGLSKTGFISEAGKCLVMQAWLANKPTIIVLLDSWGKLTRIADAQRIKRWVETTLASKDGTIRG
ncbi:D-alanyl-D-alanine endopeptidase [Sulfuricystis multivorans]|uniref:D-alanyl-D-alanine endopeptidase n=1 Tax=Sulfuricystis multivorans TaxID=2211108 RepID=UPI000F82236B|nr:D-alanyl-D-alanine endopeptidase [Sulfuricystis multivorans]